MRCAGCNREMKDGDLCITPTVSEALKMEPSDLDDLVATILSGSEKTDELVYCLGCTERGGPFEIEVYHDRPD